jgi:hypothetical protein
MEEKPTLRAKPHGAHQLHAMPKPAKGKFTKQALAEAFSSYNKKTGYLINRYWDWGLDTRVYTNVDDRVPVDTIVRIYQPQHSLMLKNLDLDNYTAFKTKLGPEWYPAQEAARSAKIIAIVRGTIKIDTTGNYTFYLKSNTGATFQISDMKTDAAVNGAIDDEAASPTTQKSIVLKGPQMANVQVYWHSPPVGTDHVLRLEYSGPDTDDAKVRVAGAHWLNDNENPPFKPLDPATLKSGFGVRFVYPNNKRKEVPEDIRLFRNITPDFVAQIPSIEIENHDGLRDLVDKVKAGTLPGAGDLKSSNVPTNQVLVYLEGYINITTGGEYIFYGKNDGGIKVTVDQVTLVDNRTEHDPSVTSPTFDPTVAALAGPMTLPKGYHEVRLAAILSKFDPDTLPMGQELSLLFKGPDTLGGADATLDDGAAPEALKGIYQEDKFGDILTVKTRTGKSAKGRYMGGGGAFEKERNPLENFDKDWYDENKAKKWKKYDFNGEDWDKDIAGVADKIVKPWTDYTAKANAYADDGATRKIPDAVYDKPPPFDPAVVDIGGKGITWLHKEAANGLNGETAVIGSDYVFHPWGKTVGSIPEANTDLSMPNSVEYAGGHGTPPTTFGGDKGK